MKKPNNRYFQIKFSDLIRRLVSSRIFLSNFLCLMGMMSFIFLIFALIIFSQSRNIMEQEFTISSQYQLEETAQTVDTYLKDMRYLAATLDTNSMVQAFFSYKNPETFYNDYYNKVQDILKAYVNGFPAIDSIYLYSEYTNTILTATEKSSLSYFKDTNWLDELDADNTGFQIYFRAKYDYYPYVLSIVKQLNANGYNAAIVINVNLNNLSQLSELNQESHRAVYLISDDSEILFRNQQRNLTEPLSLIAELSNFRSEEKAYAALLTNGNAPYAYTQIHSDQYPWSYVMITQLYEYSSRISSSRAVFITLLFSLFFAVLLLSFLLGLRSARPIQNLLQLFQNPEASLSHIYNDKEIRYIADQIAGYIQQNQTLTDELSARLNLLNQTKMLALQSQINPHFLFNTLNMLHIQECEALGYDHKIPKMTLSLSKLLRYAIESTDLVFLKTEIDFTRMYIDLLKERYNNKLNVIYDIEDSTLNAKVPKLFLQPLVENAVFHGLAEHMSENSTLTLSCCRNDAFIVVSVADNGIGMSPETLAHLREELKESVPLKNSIGIKNVVTRMNLLYGGDFSLEIDSLENQGTVFTLRFPILQ